MSGALVALLAATRAAAAQPPLASHEVNADHTLTLRFYAPGAKEVTAYLDYSTTPMPLVLGSGGIWSLTTAPLAPELHFYSFTVDGVGLFDPYNPDVDANLFYKENSVHVPGPPQPWHIAAIPHGVVHHHIYTSRIIEALPDGTEDYYIYTPPGYTSTRATPYPVLYLLHGWSSLAGAWITNGQADRILDHLLAEGKIVPMVVVMPLGYGDLRFVTGGMDQWKDEKNIRHNADGFSRALREEIIPQVEAAYRVSRRREDRAIAGLSMGGGESLEIGLNHPELFAWIGGFSASVHYKDPAPVYPAIAKLSVQAPRLLWIACGTEEELLAPNRAFVSWLKQQGAHPVAVETPGIHNWPVWREDLLLFTPLLFRH